MAFKRQLNQLKSDLDKAKKELDKHPADLKAAQLQVDYGLMRVVNAERDYAAMKKKDISARLKPLEADIAKIKDIIDKEDDRIKAFTMLKDAIKDINIVEKESKAN